ncbi:MAG: hypothetical protein PHF45_01865 [Candidatus Pacebacteria bacterium]|nr:hypothetical protein [Candidatus Paceibacterota bacterium]
MKVQNIVGKIWFFIGGCILISFLLSWSVFQKTMPNFPVIFRSNEFGINFLGHRNLIWVIPILGMIFISINFWLRELLEENSEIQEKNLSWLLFFANIGIAVLALLISIQIYILNL